MAKSTLCRPCYQALRRQAQNTIIESRPILNRRPVVFTSTTWATQPKNIRTYATSSTQTPPPPAEAAVQDAARQTSAPGISSLATRMRGVPGDIAEPYIARGATEALFKECARQADYIVPEAFDKDKEIPKNEAGEDIGQGTGWWYDNLGLPAGFASWSQVTMLHMYLLTVRLRYFAPQYSGIWMQNLNDHYFFEAEHRMTIFHAISARGVRQKYLKDLYDQWRGVVGAYDEGLIKGDAVLAAAVWRNVFKAREDVDWTKVAQVVAFMRRGLRALDKAQDRQIVGGMIKFATPMSEAAIVEAQSEWVNRPFGPEDEEALQKALEELKSAK